MGNKKMLEKAAKKFINKVETGRARSKETYRELKEALSTDEEVIENPKSIKDPGDSIAKNIQEELRGIAIVVNELQNVLTEIETGEKFPHIDIPIRPLTLSKLLNTLPNSLQSIRVHVKNSIERIKIGFICRLEEEDKKKYSMVSFT